MLRRFVPIALGVVSLALLGCSGQIPTEDPTGRTADPIVNGTPDDAATDDAIVAVLAFAGMGEYTECTGTVIKADANNIYVLTAAHCCPPDMPPTKIIQGSDYFMNPTARFDVTKYLKHPLYTIGGDAAQPFDFCMITASLGGLAAPPVIPAMTKATDNVTGATSLIAVGFGQTVAGPEGSDQNTHRNMTGTIHPKEIVPSATNPRYQAIYDETATGTCFGDSGGPDLTIGAGRAVFGVHSFVSGECNMESGSGIVSSVFDSFITPYLDGTTPTYDCSQCTSAAQDGACAAATNTCAMNNDCIALANCVAFCSNPSCVQACDKAHPTSVDAFNAYNSCICDTACASVCATSCAASSANTTASSSIASSSSVSSTGSASPGSGGNGAGGGNGGGNSDSANSDGGCSFGGAPLGSAFAMMTALAALSFSRRRRSARKAS